VRCGPAAAGNLIRLSLPSGQVTARLRIPGADSSTVAADASGTMLLVGEAREGIGALQRRDPISGAVQASTPTWGVAAPHVAGAIGDSVWISESTGMQGFVERLDASTLHPDRRTLVEGSNAIHATLANGLVWITQPDGGTAHNYCADPRTARVLAPLTAVVASAADVLAVDAQHIYYAPPTGASISTVPLPEACHRA
jgi:hypothetical protein